MNGVSNDQERKITLFVLCQPLSREYSRIEMVLFAMHQPMLESLIKGINYLWNSLEKKNTNIATDLWSLNAQEGIILLYIF